VRYIAVQGQVEGVNLAQQQDPRSASRSLLWSSLWPSLGTPVRQFPALRPSAEAFNFREDMPAATEVLDALSPCVPFVVLGKHAARRVGVTVDDFERWTSLASSDSHQTRRPASSASLDSQDTSSHCAPLAMPSLLAMAVAQMNTFRLASPDTFYQIYRIPERLRTDAADWYRALPDGVISMPYDPLLVLALVRPDLFQPQYAVGGPHTHMLIGNSEEEHGVPDRELVRAALSALVQAGLARSRAHR
jgi:hypothetical protein